MELTEKELVILAYWLKYSDECCREYLPEEHELLDKIENNYNAELFEQFSKEVNPNMDES